MNLFIEFCQKINYFIFVSNWYLMILIAAAELTWGNGTWSQSLSSSQNNINGMVWFILFLIANDKLKERAKGTGNYDKTSDVPGQ